MIENQSIKALIVTCNSKEVDLIASELQSNGASVVIATDYLNALLKVFETESNVILLKDDILDNSELCTRLRDLSGIPIIVIGNDRSNKAWVRAVELGGEAYVKETIGNGELIARIKAILRRYS